MTGVGISPIESASHTNFTRLWWQLESQPCLSAASPLPSASTHHARLLRSGHFSRLEGGWDARRSGWMGGRGVGARSGCCDLRKFCSTETKRVLNRAFTTRSIALAQPPALLLPGGPDMCTFFLSNSQWFNFNDVTEPRTGARRLGFLFFCWWLINEV